MNPALIRQHGVLGSGRVFVRASGTRVWDDEGRAYLDFAAGNGAAVLGHNHPRLAERVTALLAEQPVNLITVGPGILAADLAEELVERAGRPFEIALFSSTGGEAIEAALKVARAATGRFRIVSCEEGFHGLSLGGLSLSGEERLRKPFEPLLDGCERVRYGDLLGLEKKLKRKDVAAFIVEPIAKEFGVLPAPGGYLQGAQQLCRETGTLFVVDESQIGLGRTGTLFAFQAEDDVVPDVLVLADSLGGALVPVAATLVSADTHQKAYGSSRSFDLHDSTYAGSALGSAVALATLSALDEGRLVRKARERGDQLLDGLKTRLKGHPLVKDIRGRGLLVGIELGPTESGLINWLIPGVVGGLSELVFGQWAALKLLERGILCQPAARGANVLKLTPPLTVKALEIKKVVDAVAGVLSDYRDIASLIKDVTLRISGQLLSGQGFR